MSEKNTPKDKTPMRKTSPEENSPKVNSKLDKSTPKCSTKVKKESKIKKEVIANGDGSLESSAKASSSEDERRDDKSLSKENVEGEPAGLVPG